MFAGFDYGTSNCALGVIVDAAGRDTSGRTKLLNIDGQHAFMPSALYALERELICESVAQNIADKTKRQTYIEQRRNLLVRARNVRSEHGIASSEQSLFTGRSAFDQYIADPSEGYFIKSPKSFLGASGLRPESVAFFEDIVCAMMQTIKQRGEVSSQREISQVVIGRPVNFQGIHAEKSNKQAIDILRQAAERAGFTSVEFLYEPLAAGMDFETRLTSDKTVLVVDVGGGTTDCSMVRMGPGHCQRFERQQDFLGHSGERIGGNDLDIQLTAKALMPLFGMESLLKNGLRMPTQHFWNAAKTNDLGAQTTFNSLACELSLKQLLVDSREPELLQRFIKLRRDQQNHHLVRSAEQCKIALSEHSSHSTSLDYIEAGLSSEVSQQQLANAIDGPINKIVSLMQDAMQQAGCQPQLIYVTGGSAKSPLIHAAIERQLGAIEVVDGDHFGSVAAGLSVWAEKIFR
tara:strand:+ start:819 stop:2204 length:1386 start_codon:yes stop_codon:yes gene_type:complete